jgi:RNA recognition motif-containing protein
MTENLFVGGLPYETTQEELMELFLPWGTVRSVKLIMDGVTGRNQGFGFVEMSTEAEARAAIAKLNGTILGERQLFVGEPRSQERPAVTTRPAEKPPQDVAKTRESAGKRKPPEKPTRPVRKPKDFGGRKKLAGKRARPGRRNFRRSS